MREHGGRDDDAFVQDRGVAEEEEAGAEEKVEDRRAGRADEDGALATDLVGEWAVEEDGEAVDRERDARDVAVVGVRPTELVGERDLDGGQVVRRDM